MTNGLFKKAAARVTQDMEALMVIPMAQDVYLDEMVKSSWWDRGNPCKYYGVTPEEAASITENFPVIYEAAEKDFQKSLGVNWTFYHGVMSTNQLLRELDSMVTIDPPEGVEWALDGYTGPFWTADYRLLVENNEGIASEADIEAYAIALKNSAKVLKMAII